MTAFAALAQYGRSVDYFLEQFPSVRREQVNEVLTQAEQVITREVQGGSSPRA